MGNVNKVMLMGNLTRDPEVRYLPSGNPVCEFGMAVNRKWAGKDGKEGEEVLFVDVTLWGKRGEVVSEYFSKGDPIFVEGRLTLDTWEKDGQKRSKVKVTAENFEFVSNGRQMSTSAEDSAHGRDSSGDVRGGRTHSGESQDVSEDEVPF